MINILFSKKKSIVYSHRSQIYIYIHIYLVRKKSINNNLFIIFSHKFRTQYVLFVEQLYPHFGLFKEDINSVLKSLFHIAQHHLECIVFSFHRCRAHTIEIASIVCEARRNEWLDGLVIGGRITRGLCTMICATLMLPKSKYFSRQNARRPPKLMSYALSSGFLELQSIAL